MSSDFQELRTKLAQLTEDLELNLERECSRWVFEDLNLLLDVITAKAELHELNEERLNLVMESTGVGIWDWDVSQGTLVLNERWASMLGHELHDFEPVSINLWEEFTHPEDRKASVERLIAHWKGQTEQFVHECRMRHRDGHWVWVLVTGKAVEWDANNKVVRMTGTHLDITHQKQALEALEEQARLVERKTRMLKVANWRLRRLSEVDSVTCIPNRMVYERTFEHEVRAARRSESSLSVLMIDIDDFKLYNDHYGHVQGDDVLRRVAQKIQERLMRSTDFVARYGGEEFVVILPYTDNVSAMYVAEKIRRSVQEAFIEHKNSTVADCITLSIGIATQAGQLTDKMTLVENADSAMYHAKRSGKNRCVSSDYL